MVLILCYGYNINECWNNVKINCNDSTNVATMRISNQILQDGIQLFALVLCHWICMNHKIEWH